MSAPEKIYINEQLSEKAFWMDARREKGEIFRLEYTRTDLSQASVAAALEVVADEIGDLGDSLTYIPAFGQGLSARAYAIATKLTALITPDQHDALQAAIDAEDAARAGWQPMTTAPQHKPIIGIDGHGEVFRCWWQRDSLDGTEYWQNEADSEPQPVAWMPLHSLSQIGAKP